MNDLGMDRSPPRVEGEAFAWFGRARRLGRRWVSAVVVALAVLVVTGVAEPAPDRVVGVLPDGTRFELLVSSGTEIGEVEGVFGALVWADGPSAGQPIGSTGFTYTDGAAYQGLPKDRTTVEGAEEWGRLFVPAGVWAMVIDLADWSRGRESELQLVEAREHADLPVISLPPSMRWAEPGELPVRMSVSYQKFAVVRGCADYGKCSPDGRIMVLAYGEDSETDTDAGLSDVRVRVID